MTTLFIRHQVTDYSAWRRVYDEFAPTQKALGVKAEAVYQAADDPNDLTVTHDFATLAIAKAFSASPELRATMHGAGVQGAPTIWYATRS
jgi:hypothetical protein